MRLSLLLLALAPLAALAQSPEPDLEGSWAGTLQAGPTSLRIVFHLERVGTEYAASLDSPDQGAFGLPAGPVSVRRDSVTISVPAVQGTYEGVVRSDTLIEGAWSQLGSTLPLTLRPASGEGPARPQEPHPPYPYDEERVRFEGGGPDVTLAGTLSLPRSDGPHPAVVLVSGSGPQDRDEALAGHKPFLVLADYLTRRGIAVLRYDDRGVAASTGSFETAALPDFAADAAGAVAFLRARADIAEVGIVGHSEGALVAPMVANAGTDAAVAFLVLIAPPAVPGDSLLTVQNRLIFEQLGLPAGAVATYNAAQREAFALAASADPEALDTARAQIKATMKAGLDRLSPEERALFGAPDSTAQARLLDQQAAILTQPGIQSFLAYDPRPALRAVDVPVLALFGGKDVQVPPDFNRPALEAALTGHDAATVEVFPDLNHLFQTARTGAPTEYAQIKETFAPAALERIGDWILRVLSDE